MKNNKLHTNSKINATDSEVGSDGYHSKNVPNRAKPSKGWLTSHLSAVCA